MDVLTPDVFEALSGRLAMFKKYYNRAFQI